MALQSTGWLGMITGATDCRSISAAVCGSAQASSLCSMFQAGGFSIPNSMTNFHGYIPPVWKCVDFCTTSSGGGGTAYAYSVNCFKYSTALVANECFCACICAWISTTQQAVGSWAQAQVICNGLNVFCCCVGPNVCVNTLGCAFCVDYNDTIIINLFGCAANISCPSVSCACACLFAVTCCSGCGRICKGSSCGSIAAISG